MKIDEQKGEHAIAVVLRYGSLAATAIMAAGLVLAIGHGTAGFAVYHRLRLSVLAAGLARLEPAALTQGGILLLMLTPIFRIVVAVATFALERDYRYVLVSLGVLAVVLASISFAVG